MTTQGAVPPSSHIIGELGFGIWADGDEMRGSAVVTPEMCVPSTSCVRTSILALLVDLTTGLRAVNLFAPKVPVTLELDVQLIGPPTGCTEIRTVGHVLKAGRSVVVLSVDLTDGDGELIALGHGTFVAPDPNLVMPPDSPIELVAHPPELAIPFAERARCERRGAGVAVLQRSEDGLNAADSVNGGLLALVAEEAALSAAPDTTLSALAMRYLQPARVGPVVGTADTRAHLGRVEMRDAGNDDRLVAMATTRTF